MKKYPKMKPSGVEWIGDVPEHWGIARFKYFYRSGMGETILKEDLVEEGIPVFSATENDEIFGFVSSVKLILEKGDFVIPARGNSIGHIMEVEQKCTSTQTTIYSKKVSQEVQNRFAFHFLKGLRANLFFFDRTAIPQITVHQVGNNPFLVPPLPEQLAIAAYLDRKTAQIDQTIAEKERLIELFREERQAIINHAVTKGIRPGAKMKPSGVEWIGDVPEGWEVKKLKYVSELIQTGKTPPSGEEKYYQDGDANWFNPSDFSGEILLKESQRKVSRLAIEEGEIKAYKAKTVLLVGIGATMGKVGIIDKEGCSNQQINAITVNEEKANPFFVAYFLESFSHVIVSYSNASTLAIFNQTQTKNFKIVVPPRAEQDQVVIFIDQKTAQIDTAISGIRQEIALLQEYRQALIFEAVTGKIDVREHA
ncbi:MAG: restriction endonuclease subunit S [Saprospiraceae bacterium]